MNSHIKLAAAAASAAAFVLAGPACASEIFYDSFEEPVVDTWAVFQVNVGDNADWTAVDGAGIEIQNENAGVSDAYDGEQYVELDSDNTRGGLPGDTNSAMVANVAFVEGQTYNISFAYKPRTDTTGDNGIELYAVDYDGVSVNDYSLLTLISETTSTLSDWMVYTVTYTATLGMNAIGFRAVGADNSLGGFIDAVSVSEVPLPAALPLFLAGVAGFGFAGRRKRKDA